MASGDIPVEVRISRASMPGDLDELVIKSDRSTPLTLVRFREPSLVPDITYSDKRRNMHGDGVPMGWSYRDVLHDWSVAARDRESEAEARAAVAELAAALGRLVYPVVVVLADAPPETWTCRPGSVLAAGDREWPDLRHFDPIWNVTIPAHPIRSV